MIDDLAALARLHAPQIFVFAPFLGAALAFISPWRTLAWATAFAGVLIAAIVGADLFARALLAGAPIALPREGVALSADGVAVFAAPMLAGAGALVLLAYAGVTLAARTAPIALALAATSIGAWGAGLFAADWTGLVLMACAGWAASVALVAMAGDQDRAALNGAFRMLTWGGVASVLMFVGGALATRGIGAAELSAIESARIAGPGLATFGVILFVLGGALMAGAAPLHAWVGAAYGRSGAAATLVMGVVCAVGALAMVVRVATHAMGAPAMADEIAAGVAALGVSSAIIGSVQAIGARNLPRLLAYAAAAQVGCILLSAALGSQAGIAAALVQMLALCASALAILGGAAAAGGVQSMEALDGLGRRAPFASAAIAAGALGLMGAPLSIAFLGRWRLIEASVGAGWWWVAVAAIGATLAGVFYGARLIERVYFRRAASAAASPPRFHWAFAPALLVATAAILLGLEPSILLQAAANAARMMIGGAL